MEEVPKLTMTESLANGLKNRFFSEMLFDKKALGFLKLSNKDIPKNRKDFEKFIDKSIGFYKEFDLLHYEGGSTRKPYLAFELLTIDPKREFNTWNEKCVYGSSVIFNLNPFVPHNFYSTYNISEHTIARIFLRTPPIIKNNLIEVKEIYHEFKFIPMWAAFWGILFFSLASKNININAYPVIPGPNGLFMAEINKNDKRIEIRTFVNDEDLTFEQLNTKKALIEIGKLFEVSPLCFWGPVSQLSIDHPQIIVALMAYLLNSHNSFESIKNVLFHREPDDEKRLWSKKSFDSEIKIQKENVHMILIEHIEKIGIRKFMLEINQDFLKKPPKN
jgi:hypothetical protein